MSGENIYQKSVLGYKETYNMEDEELKKYKNLHSLDLSHNNTISDEGLEHLPFLVFLDISYQNAITDAGLKYLTNLQDLNVTCNTTITIEGLRQLPNLKHLSLKYDQKLYRSVSKCENRPFKIHMCT